MKQTIRYKGYFIEPHSYKLRSGGWVPRAWVTKDTGDRLHMRPIYSRTQVRATREEADKYAVELGKAWIEKNS